MDKDLKLISGWGKEEEEMSELLPCPFCGSKVTREDCVENTGGNRRFIWCANCSTRGPWSTALVSATKQWNHRSLESVRSEEKFWVVEAVNEDDTVLSPPAYWYGGFVGSTVAGHVGSDIHALCTRFQNAQTAEYVKCLLRNAKIKPDRGHHWKIFKHIVALSPAREDVHSTELRK